MTINIKKKVVVIVTFIILCGLFCVLVCIKNNNYKISNLNHSTQVVVNSSWKPWDSVPTIEKVYYLENLVFYLLEPQIDESITKFYGESRQYYNEKIVKVKDLGDNTKQMQLQVTTFV